MSAYLTVDLQIRDEGCLVAALEEMAYTVERHPDGAVVHGYQGDDRRGHVIVRRGTHADTKWEDMAFERQADGTLQAHLSTHMAKGRVNEIRRRYAVKQVEKTARARGYSVASKESQGRVKLVLRRYA